jgi:threonylcarbamoyladenosine tRNA methylthiotransferase MtaB
VLTGINLGAYQFDLIELIEELSYLKELLRLRLSSIEPVYLKQTLIDCIAQNPKLCRHLHIPLQSGDDAILKSMNRNYTGQDFIDLVQAIRKKVPDCAITTDIIVGYPGEGEKQFQNTMELINQLRFSRIHIFSYSKRDGTVANTLPHQVKAEIKKARNRRLHLLREKYMAAFAREYSGEEVEILVERKGEGLTSNYIRVLYPGNETDVGKLKKLTIKEIKKDHCLASC